MVIIIPLVIVVLMSLSFWLGLSIGGAERGYLDPQLPNKDEEDAIDQLIKEMEEAGDFLGDVRGRGFQDYEWYPEANNVPKGRRP